VGKGAIRAFSPAFDGLWRRAHVSVADMLAAEGGHGAMAAEDDAGTCHAFAHPTNHRRAECHEATGDMK
jgi:hypothetical protein